MDYERGTTALTEDRRQNAGQKRPECPAPPRRRQTFARDPGLKAGQVWFDNYVEQRLPVQQITLDVDRSAEVTWTFYRRHEFRAFLGRCLERLAPEEVREIADAILQAERREEHDGKDTQDPKTGRAVGKQR